MSSADLHVVETTFKCRFDSYRVHHRIKNLQIPQSKLHRISPHLKLKPCFQRTQSCAPSRACFEKETHEEVHCYRSAGCREDSDYPSVGTRWVQRSGRGSYRRSCRPACLLGERRRVLAYQGSALEKANTRGTSWMLLLLTWIQRSVLPSRKPSRRWGNPITRAHLEFPNDNSVPGRTA